MAFNYEADTDADAVLSVADSIRSSCRLAPLTDEQKERRRLEIEDWQEAQRWRAEDRRAERERQQAELESAARAEHAANLAEYNRRARQEYLARQEQQHRSNDLSALRYEAQQSAVWRNTVRNAIAYQQRQTLINELEAAITPPTRARTGSDLRRTGGRIRSAWYQ